MEFPSSDYLARCDRTGSETPRHIGSTSLETSSQSTEEISIMIAKPRTVAVAAALTAFIVGSAAVPAVAAPGYDACFTLSLERGSGPNKGGGAREHAQHKAFMDQCLAGTIPGAAEASPAAARLPADAYALTVASKRISRHAAPAHAPTVR
jgi:hypothetical protein